MRYVILDPTTQVAQLLPATDGQALAGKTVLDAADDFAWLGSTVDWAAMAIVPDVEWALDRLRARRDALLAATDWWMMADVIAAASPELQEARLAYRQALRDWPATETDPFHPTEPTLPA